MKVNIEPFQKGKAEQPVDGALRREVMADGRRLPDAFSQHRDLVQPKHRRDFSSAGRGDRNAPARLGRRVAEGLNDMPRNHHVSRAGVESHPYNAAIGALEDFDLDRDEAGPWIKFHASERRGVTLFEGRTRIDDVQPLPIARPAPDLLRVFGVADQPAGCWPAPSFGRYGDSEPFVRVMLYQLFNGAHGPSTGCDLGAHTPTITADRGAGKGIFCFCEI